MFSNRISETLHNEHRATLMVMERAEGMVTRHRRAPPDVKDVGTAQLLRDIADGVEAEVQRHFDFEEAHVFPFLESIGDRAIGAHLTDEHSAMRPLGEQLATLARKGASEGFATGEWDQFRRITMELIERMLAHVQKEEMALLPLVEDAMDKETEARLYADYVAKG